MKQNVNYEAPDRAYNSRDLRKKKRLLSAFSYLFIMPELGSNFI